MQLINIGAGRQFSVSKTHQRKAPKRYAMMHKVTIVWIIFIFSLTGYCQSNESLNKLIQKNDNGLLDSIYSEITFFKNQFNIIDSAKWFYVYQDTIVDSMGGFAVGKRILDPFGEFNEFKIGTWTQYYQTNAIKSIEYYCLGAVTLCQSGGPTVSGYNIKCGQGKYYYRNGTLKSKGDFALQTKEFRGNCGIDSRFESIINSDWLFYDENGNSINVTEDLIKEIEGI